MFTKTVSIIIVNNSKWITNIFCLQWNKNYDLKMLGTYITIFVTWAKVGYISKIVCYSVLVRDCKYIKLCKRLLNPCNFKTVYLAVICSNELTISQNNYSMIVQTILPRKLKYTIWIFLYFSYSFYLQLHHRHQRKIKRGRLSN